MENKKGKLTDKYEVGLMIVSILVIVALVAALTLFPVEGKEVAAKVLSILTETFGSPMMLVTLGVVIFLIAICFTKYGEIRFGNEKPQYSTLAG